MSRNVPPFVWSKRRLEAAQLLADGVLTDEQIAEKIRVSRRQLTRWKAVSEFCAKVTELAKVIEQRILARGVAQRVRRVEALDARWERMQRVITERAADPKMQGVPGGTTGLLVHQMKGIGKGDDFQVVHEYAVDTGLLKELREHERQAAQELGQLVNKVAPVTPDGESEYGAGLSESERSAIILAICTRLGAVSPGPSDTEQGTAGRSSVD